MSLRVAAVQLAVTEDVEENLATVLRMTDEAAATGAKVVVLPEFSNHVSWYSGREHSASKALTLDGPWLAAVGAKAKEHAIYLMVNVTLKREGGRLSGSNVLFAPEGEILSVSDKQVLMGSERDHFEGAVDRAPLVETDVATFGLYSCMDGVINETPRMLALDGGTVLLNSINSFALDEATLHVPVRAVENKVWIVAANKVGPLVPEHSIHAVSEKLGVPVERLHGVGEAQIVAPDGTVVAIAPTKGEAVVWADIDVDLALDKKRKDGTDVFASRRPDLYGPIAEEPKGRQHGAGAATVEAVAVTPRAGESIADLLDEALVGAPGLVVLPELAAHEGGLATGAVDERLAPEAIAAKLAGTETLVVTSVVDGGQHVGLVIGADGVVGRQVQLHRSERHAGWVTELGNEVIIVEAPFGRLGVLVGDDNLYPEAYRLVALKDADVVAAPFTVEAGVDLDPLLLERAAENRVNLVAGGRAVVDGDAGVPGGIVVPLSPNFTLWGSDWERPFDGVISRPEPIIVDAPLVRATLRPACATNRFVSKGTDVVDGRPWYLADSIVRPIA
ncbi:nitrilase-related carbon-nitrogen hydrolase [Nocardioides yefusunii]|uniref:Nitrilase-related carbon-nitrogen hydrolase n=1 Tax=Nocardioides yefusunii TaxID=2500546 RepID=A0ABW1QSA6_9ACTN|nr:nitrilase-related carbon-nitrogen hydrolase [Nocardioides yefusunii]